MAEQDNIGGDEFDPEPKGKWAIVGQPGTSIWYAARVEEGTEVGEPAFDLIDCREEVYEFFPDDVQETLKAWAELGGDGPEANEKINAFLTRVCAGFKGAMKKIAK